MKTVGIVAFSFALRENREPNPCNIRLANEVIRIAKAEERNGNEVVVVAQWEIAKALGEKRFPILLSVERTPGKYLDSEDVMEGARKIFKERKIQEVIPVAQPFLQIIKCRKLVSQAGFKLLHKEIRRIGFDPQSDRSWTRSAINLLIYAVKQTLLGTKGK